MAWAPPTRAPATRSSVLRKPVPSALDAARPPVAPRASPSPMSPSRTLSTTTARSAGSSSSRNGRTLGRIASPVSAAIAAPVEPQELRQGAGPDAEDHREHDDDDRDQVQGFTAGSCHTSRGGASQRPLASSAWRAWGLAACESAVCRRRGVRTGGWIAGRSMGRTRSPGVADSVGSTPLEPLTFQQQKVRPISAAPSAMDRPAFQQPFPTFGVPSRAGVYGTSSWIAGASPSAEMVQVRMRARRDRPRPRAPRRSRCTSGRPARSPRQPSGGSSSRWRRSSP